MPISTGALGSLLLVSGGIFWLGSLAPSVWGGVLIAVGLALGVWSHNWRPRRLPWDWPIGILAVLGGLSLLVTAQHDVTLPKVVGLWAGLALAYFLACWAYTSARIVTLAWGQISVSVIVAVAAPFVVQWSRNKFALLPPTVYSHFHLLISNSIHPNTMASLMVLLAPLPLAWGWQQFQSSRRRWGAIGLLVGSWCLMMLILLLTQSRGGIIAGAVGVLTAVWLMGKRKTALGLAMLLLILGGVAGLYLTRHPIEVPQFAERGLNPSTMAFRLHVWRVALWMISDFPFTGVGMGLFNTVGNLLYPFNETQNPGTHNLYLGVAVDLGIPGLIAFLALLLVLFRMMSDLPRGDTRVVSERYAIAVGAFSGLAGIFAHGLFDNTAWNTRALSLLWLVVGIFTAAYLLKGKK